VSRLANPHPSGDEKYVVVAIKRRDGQVLVRYVNGGPSWWINESAWGEWRRLGPVDEAVYQTGVSS
jgi:hypothetical protein